MSRLMIGGELVLSGDVLLDDYAGWMGDDDAYFTPRLVREAIAGAQGRLTVRLNSYGGHVAAGEQIRAILAAHEGGVRVVVEGVAASAASLVFTAGTERVMTRGSFLMIHDPRGGLLSGTSADFARESDVLEKMADTYAAIYAAASGQDKDAIRGMMLQETWFSADEAVAMNFADQVIQIEARQAPETKQAARASYVARHGALAARLSAEKAAAGGPVSLPAAACGTEAPKAASVEIQMEEQNPAAVAATPAPVPVMQIDEAIAAERQRVKRIREMAAPFMAAGRLAATEVDVLIDTGTPADMAASRILTAISAAEPPVARQAATITRDETDTRMEGMIGALMGETTGPASQYRGLRVRRMALELSGSSRGFNEAEAIRRGMIATQMRGGAHGISDFAYITTEVMNRSLLAQYERRAATWTAVCGQAENASDFREMYTVRFGGDMSLKPVDENGEYQSAVLEDETEGLKVERRGRTINLTFEAVMNDYMGAFARIPTEFAIAARTMESSMVWGLIRTNARLKSANKQLFHVDFNNTVAATAINATSVAAARARMWEQRPYGSKDGDDFMVAEPDRLIVPPALELTALQFVSATMPATDGNVNPYKSSLSVITVPNLGVVAGGADNRWYLVASALPPIAHAYLDGYAAPTIQTIEGMNPDVVTMNARHIFGAAPRDFRGIQRIGQPA